MDQRERIKQTVEKDRSPPDKDFMSSKEALFPSPGWTFNYMNKEKINWHCKPTFTGETKFP